LTGESERFGSRLEQGGTFSSRFPTGPFSGWTLSLSLKNFSLIRNEEGGDYTLTPAYDLLNTRLHVPNESRTALALFRGDFETESYRINGYYAYDDFQELAHRLELHPGRFQRFMDTAVNKGPEIFALIDRSMLTEQCKQMYKDHVSDSLRALSYSYAKASR